MGTRNLTMVVLNKETKVAQYGQWDGYPAGQGKTILEFLRSADMEKFRKAIEETRFATQDEIDKLNKDIEKTGKFPQEFSRDAGGKILDMILNKGIRLLVNKEGFAKDSLFCEWAYVVNLDDNTLEVYQGFNKQPLKEGERFFHADTPNVEYHPVRFLGSVSLTELPSAEEFINRFENAEAEND